VDIDATKRSKNQASSSPLNLKQVLLNCDLGEGYDDVDRKVMPFIDQANIACGGHAGDTDSMQTTVGLALKRSVSIGAHPSYPDKENFGRVSINYEPEHLLNSLLKQVSSLEEICKAQGAKLDYIKAHGALYNDSAKNSNLMNMLLKLAKSFQCGLMLPAQLGQQSFSQAANEYGVKLIREGFADRSYTDEGFLVPRSTDGAVYENIEHVVQQASLFAKGKPVISHNGKPLNLKADSICVHGDNEKAIEALQRIYDTLH